MLAMSFYARQFRVHLPGGSLSSTADIFVAQLRWKLLSRGYCVDTVGLDQTMIQKYVKYQESKERISEKQLRLF